MILFFSDNPMIFEGLKRFLADKDWTYEFACSPGSGLAREIRVKDELEALKRFDLIVSGHCKQIFPAKLVNAVRCVNLHPGYNPDTRGWYPQSFALAKGLRIGFTVHLMNEDIDAGEIIFRQEVEPDLGDTSYSLYHRVVAAEIASFEHWLPNLVESKFQSKPPENEGNYHSKADFDDLCEIDLEESGTFKDFYNRLRALSFPPHRNAYFEKDGRKFYLHLSVDEE